MVVECAVVGKPDPQRGTIVQAFVVLTEGTPKDASTIKLLQDHVKASIAPYKYPRDVRFIDGLPNTPTGKIQRFALRENP